MPLLKISLKPVFPLSPISLWQISFRMSTKVITRRRVVTVNIPTDDRILVTCVCILSDLSYLDFIVHHCKWQIIDGYDNKKNHSHNCVSAFSFLFWYKPGLQHTYDVFCQLRKTFFNLYTVHYNDVIMGAIPSQITSLTIVYSTVYADADQRKHQRPASLAFVRGIHRDRWIPRTNGQYPGKCFHLMTSSW